MKNLTRLSSVCTVSAVLLGSAQLGVAQGSLQNVSARATIATSNCSTALCQPATGPSPCNNGAGPNPDTISASVSMCQVNGALRVIGAGTGFRFGTTYISLVYFNGNVGTCSRFPDGVTPTLQNLPQADPDFASMMLGIWQVNLDGSATLAVAKQAPVLGLQNYKTVSIREVQTPNVSCYNTGFDPAPQLNALRACGSLTFGAACSQSDVCAALCQINPSICTTNIIDPAVCAAVPSPPPN
jgi:hypothetical protein